MKEIKLVIRFSVQKDAFLYLGNMFELRGVYNIKDITIRSGLDGTDFIQDFKTYIVSYTAVLSENINNKAFRRLNKL